MQEIIDIIIFTIATIISLLFYNVCFTQVSNTKIKWDTKKLLILTIGTLLVVINNYYTNVNYKFIVNSIVVTVYFKLMFEQDWKSTIIVYIIIFTIGILIELLTTNLLLALNVLNNNTSAYYVSYLKIMLSILVYFLEAVVFLIPPIKKILKKIIRFFVKNINSINMAYLLFLVMGLLSVLNAINFTNTNSIKLIIILFSIFIVLFLLVIRLKSKEIILKNSNKKLIEYNENYGKFLDEYKIYKHNINHKLKAIMAYGNKKINSLIEELLQDETQFSIKNNNLHNLPKGIKGIIAEKLYNKDYDVLIDNKITGDPFSNLSPKAFNEISESIGICLDNAVEASEETDKAVISVYLYEDEEAVYIKIGNNYNNNIDLTKLGEKYYSTKNRGSGLGLFSIMRNNYVSERIYIVNGFYYIELKIKKCSK